MLGFPTPMVDFPTPIHTKMPSSEKVSHRNSVQNAMIGEFTTLTATISVTISTLMSQGPKVVSDHRKCRCPKKVRTNILCRMVRSRSSQLSRRLFSWPFLCLCLGATFGQLTANLGATFGQLLGNFWASESDIRYIHVISTVLPFNIFFVRYADNL